MVFALSTLLVLPTLVALLPPMLIAPTDGPTDGVAYIYGDIAASGVVIDVDGVRTPAIVTLVTSGVWMVDLTGYQRGVVAFPDAYANGIDVAAPFSLSGPRDETPPVWEGVVVMKDVSSSITSPEQIIVPSSFVTVTVDRPGATDDRGVALATVGNGASTNASAAEFVFSTGTTDPQCVTFSAFDFGGNRTDITGCEDDENSVAGCSNAGVTSPLLLGALLFLHRRKPR
jgi:hypothetical protein